MTSAKATKRALLSSVMALFICFAMLLGTTYAWFTDSVTSAENKIVAGTLDVDLYLWNSTSEPVEITEESAPIFGQGAVAQNDNAATLWEPGKTQVAYLSIKNNGSLDLKYKVAIKVYDVTKNLIEVLEYDITPDAKYGEVTSWANNGISVVEGTNATASEDVALKAGEEHFFALSVHMLETATNEYQDGSATFDIKVLATQLASESDSFGTDYDKDAYYAQSVSTMDALIAALEKGGDIVLESDIPLDMQLTITKDVTIDLNDHELQANMTESLDGVYDTLIRIENGATVSIYGDGAVNLADGVGRWIRCVYGATINIYGGNWVQESDDFNASSDPHYCEGIYANERGNVNIYGGTFKFDTVPYYTLNESRGGQITVYGGTFINFNPSKSAAGDGSYVAKGYMVVSEEQENGDVWYTVVPVPEGYVAVSNAKEATDALAAGEKIILSDNITLNEKLTIDTPVDIDLNGKDLATVGLELKQGGSIKNGNIKSAGDINTDGGNWVFHFLVSGGTLTMDDVNVAITDSFVADTGYNGSSQACGIRAENAKLILNNCNVKVHNDTNNVYFVQSWAVDLLDSEFTMNGGSIVAMCDKGTAADVDGLDDPAFACAISADGICTVTLNGVEVEATYFGEVFDWQDYSSNLTFNTTDTNVTEDDFILWWSAELTVNHIN